MTPMQPLLFDDYALPPLQRVPSAGRTRAERLAEYDTVNPHVYRMFRRMAEQDYRDGHIRAYAMGYIYRIRQAGVRAVQDVNGYRIPNEFATYCVRRLRNEAPHLAQLFDIRESSLDGELS